MAKHCARVRTKGRPKAVFGPHFAPREEFFPPRMSPGKMIRILSGLRRKPGRGAPFLGLSPGDGGRESPVSCLLLLEVPATRLAAKRLRRREGRCGGGTGVPGRLPASIGSACCPARRLAALPAGAFGAVSPRLPCGKGDVCERRRGRKKRAKRSGSGQNSVSDSEQRILGTMTDAPNASGVWSAEAMP